MTGSEISIEITTSLGQVQSCDWDRCADWSTGARAENPFTTYRFLHALEQSGSVGDGTGWDPYYIIARAGDDIIGVAPNYLKLHSQGEYILIIHGPMPMNGQAGVITLNCKLRHLSRLSRGGGSWRIQITSIWHKRL